MKNNFCPSLREAEFYNLGMSESALILEYYYKSGCDLCEQLEIELGAFLAEGKFHERIDIVKRDIEDNSLWFDRFHQLIPVLMLNDQQICHYFFDSEALTIALHNQLTENTPNA